MNYNSNYVSDYSQEILTEMEIISMMTSALEESINRNYGLVATVEHNRVLRTNGEADALQVRFKDSNIAPTIYPDVAVEQYQKGIPIEQIADNLAKAAVVAHWQSPIPPQLTLEEAKKSITLTLINAERNEKLLQNVPHFTIGDLAAIPRWYISEEASFVVTNDIASNLMLTGEEVLQIGQQNINDTQFDVVSMSDMLKGLLTGNDMDRAVMDDLFPDTDEQAMIVMTTNNRLHGARAILSKDALRTVQEKLNGKEFYILPSSIHEVICIPVDSGISSTYLREMVREINAAEVSAQEFLSDEIMKYDGNRISVVRDDEKFDSSVVNEKTIHYSGMHM